MCLILKSTFSDMTIIYICFLLLHFMHFYPFILYHWNKIVSVIKSKFWNHCLKSSLLFCNPSHAFAFYKFKLKIIVYTHMDDFISALLHPSIYYDLLYFFIFLYCLLYLLIYIVYWLFWNLTIYNLI